MWFRQHEAAAWVSETSRGDQVTIGTEVAWPTVIITSEDVTACLVSLVRTYTRAGRLLMTHVAGAFDHQVYYFDIAAGKWLGAFEFAITNFRKFRAAALPLKYRLLALAIHAINKFATPAITSAIQPYRDEGEAGVSRSVVSVRLFGITVYLMKGRYHLLADGRGVFVRIHERFGIWPFRVANEKTARAEIGPGGLSSTYTMPLLGGVWSGRYVVAPDRCRLVAVYESEWGRAKETIARVRDSRETAPVLPDTSLLEPQDRSANRHALQPLAKRLYDRALRHELDRDRRCVFTYTYFRITELLGHGLSEGRFDKPESVLQLADWFAAEYFAALDAYDRGEDAPGPWREVFATLATGRTSPLEDLILAMAAHLVYDLPHALLNACRSSGDKPNVRDFHEVNEVLGRSIDTIQTQVARRYSFYLSWLDWLGQGDDEVLTNYGFRLCRGMAWYNAIRLMDPTSREHTEESIARSIRIFVERVMSPSRLSTRFVLRIARYVAGRFRRWPAAARTAGVGRQQHRSTPESISL